MTVSPSASVALPGVQLRVSPSWAGSGLRVTEASSGAELSRAMVSLRAAPSSVPSLGVTVQVTVSPEEAVPAARVLPVPAVLPLMVQAMVELSASPSASL